MPTHDCQAGGTDVVSRVSTDQGATWGPLHSLAHLAGHPTATWDRTTAATILEFNAFEEGACTSRPNCTAYTAGGKIFPRGCCPNYQMTTKNGGATWAGRQAVEPAEAVAWPVRVGSGVGLQLRQSSPTHPGRLINIGWHYRQPAQDPPTLLTSFDAIFFSDDHGATWRQPAQPLQLGGLGNEAQVAELPNGNVLAMMRPGAPPEGCSTCRLLSLSSDGGNTWGWGGKVGAVHAEPQLAGVPTMASIYSDGVATYVRSAHLRPSSWLGLYPLSLWLSQPHARCVRAHRTRARLHPSAARRRRVGRARMRPGRPPAKSSQRNPCM